jgi:hypothetical protein
MVPWVSEFMFNLPNSDTFRLSICLLEKWCFNTLEILTGNGVVELRKLDIDKIRKLDLWT